MTASKEFFRSLITATLRVVLWLVVALATVVLLALALVLLLLGTLWSLVRGKKPAPPVFVGQFRRFATERVWPAGQSSQARSQAQVVDVEVREVDPAPDKREPGQISNKD